MKLESLPYGSDDRPLIRLYDLVPSEVARSQNCCLFA